MEDNKDEFVPEKEEPKLHPKHLKAERLFLAISLFVTLFLVLLSATWTSSSAGLVLMGFLPLLIIIILLSVALEQKLKQSVYWAIPIIVSFLYLAIVSITPLSNQLSVGALATINLVLGLIVVLFLIMIEGKVIFSKEVEEKFEPEKIEDYIHSIEEKCKALNFVIGRVYRTSNGGTPELRTRLRIDKDWYNEFQEILTDDIKKRKVDAEVVLHKILDRLKLLSKAERDVLTSKELKVLKNIVRHIEGADSVIDILIVNDRDPVEHYYAGAVRDTEKIIKGLKDL